MKLYIVVTKLATKKTSRKREVWGKGVIRLRFGCPLTTWGGGSLNLDGCGPVGWRV